MEGTQMFRDIFPVAFPSSLAEGLFPTGKTELGPAGRAGRHSSLRGLFYKASLGHPTQLLISLQDFSLPI